MPNRKVYKDANSALAGLKDNMTLVVGGFGLCGIPENLIRALVKKGTKNLTIISNNCGTDKYGIGFLLNNNQIRKMIMSYGGENKKFFLLHKKMKNLGPLYNNVFEKSNPCLLQGRGAFFCLF
jgi:3-oxoacid CoA-transferase subunit A